MLAYEMNEIKSTVGNFTGWADHIELLQQNLDILQIINSFRNKHVFFSNGLCGFYFFLRKIGRGMEYHDLLLRKIADSEIWEYDHILKTPLNFFGGLSGLILTYHHILNNNDSTFLDYAIMHYF